MDIMQAILEDELNIYLYMISFFIRRRAKSKTTKKNNLKENKNKKKYNVLKGKEKIENKEINKYNNQN